MGSIMYMASFSNGYFATAPFTGTTKIWTTYDKELKCIKTIEPSDHVTCLLNLRGYLLVLGIIDGRIIVWDSLRREYLS
jgi:hypothetical protein